MSMTNINIRTDSELKAEAQAVLSDLGAVLDVQTEKYASIASAWEAAIKLGTQKLQLDGGLPELFRMIDDNRFHLVSINAAETRLGNRRISLDDSILRFSTADSSARITNPPDESSPYATGGAPLPFQHCHLSHHRVF